MTTYTKDNILEQKAYLTTATNILASNLEHMLEDIKRKGVYTVNTGSILARSASVVHQNGITSVGKFYQLRSSGADNGK